MKKRIEYLDTAKGILIVLMVFGHVYLSGAFRQFFYTFHMPAFFIISGILLHHSGKQPAYIDVFKKKIYSLLIPLLFFEFIAILTDCFRGGPFLNIKGYIFNTLTLQFNYGPNWFLFSLFIAELTFILIHSCDSTAKHIKLLLTVLMSIGLVFCHSYSQSLGNVGIGLIFLSFGYYMSRYYLDQNNLLFIGSGILSVLISIINGRVDITEWLFNDIALYFIGAVSGTYFVISLSRILQNRSKLLSFYGKNTLPILGTHFFFILVVQYHTEIARFSLTMAIALFLMIMIIEIPIIHLCNRYIPFLVGKKYVKPIN